MFLCLQEKIGAFPLFPENKLRWSLKPPLLSFHVLRNYIACYLHPQKYSLMLPKIPHIFQFLIVSYFHTLSFGIDSRDTHPASTLSERKTWRKELVDYFATSYIQNNSSHCHRSLPCGVIVLSEDSHKHALVRRSYGK